MHGARATGSARRETRPNRLGKGLLEPNEVAVPILIPTVRDGIDDVVDLTTRDRGTCGQNCLFLHGSDANLNGSCLRARAFLV